MSKARKHWDAIVVDFGDYKIADDDKLATWAKMHGLSLLNEIEKLRRHLVSHAADAALEG